MPKDLSSEVLARFLRTLSSEEAEAARLYTALHESLVRFFELKGLSAPDRAADETIDRVAAKIDRNTPIDDLTNYAFGVARFVFLEELRRERIHFRAAQRFYRKNGPPAAVPAALRDCFERLAEAERGLLVGYFSNSLADRRAAHRRLFAAREGISLNTLRIRVARLRRRLEECLAEKKSGK